MSVDVEKLCERLDEITIEANRLSIEVRDGMAGEEVKDNLVRLNRELAALLLKIRSIR